MAKESRAGVGVPIVLAGSLGVQGPGRAPASAWVGLVGGEG